MSTHTETNTTLPALSTSTLSGNMVHNPQGDQLGTIKDFVIDTDTGVIVYAVLSFGGFLGFGDKLFAVPYVALSLDTEKEVYVLDVNKEKLENAPGFDEDNWPSHADYSFLDQLYTHYGYASYHNDVRDVYTRNTQPVY